MKVTCMPNNFFNSDYLLKMLFFSVLTLRRMYADSCPKRVSNWTDNLLRKWSYFDKRMFFLMLIFRDEGHLYAICLFYILNFYRNAFFFSPLVVAHVCTFPSNIGSKWTHKSPKNSHILLKKCFLRSLFSEMKVTCMPIICFLFCFFTVNALFFSYYVVTYVCIFPS